MLEISETFSFEKAKLYAEKLETKYPFLHCTIIGRSHEGRGIFAYSLGCQSNSVVIVGGTGAKSSETSLALYRFLDSVCESVFLANELSGVNFSSLMKKFGLTVIPCLNPDSVEIVTGGKHLCKEFRCEGTDIIFNANAAGVEIDLNFDSDWRKEKMSSLEKGIIFASPEGFPGNMKESEPETRAFTTFCRRRSFRSCLTLKTDSENNIYYHRKDNQPPQSAMMAKILASSFSGKLSESEMPPCPSRWFIDEFRKPSFLVKAQKCGSFQILFEKLEELLVLMAVM